MSIRPALLLLTACGTSPTPKPDSAAADPAAGGVTWAEQLAPVIDARCAGCHSGPLAPLDLSDWAVVELIGPSIVDAVEQRRMPPWAFDEAGCRPVPGSLGLRDDERQLFLDWRAAGYPRGVGPPVAGAPPPTATAPRPPDAELRAAPFLVDPGTSDPYWCGYLDGPSAAERWLEGAEIVLDDPAISHHAFLYAAPPSAQPTIDALDAAQPGPGFRCDGGLVMADGLAMLGGWAPGSPARYPAAPGAPTVGVRVPAGSRLVVEMHYNTAAIGAPAEDAPGWRVWEAAGRPTQQLVYLPLVDVELAIPAGAEGWVESATTRLPVDARLIETAPHMHGLGRSLRTTLRRPSGEELCLTGLDGYDFHWQFSYPVEGSGIPVTVEDELTIRCTFDNPGEATVGWGERTEDEMCLDYLAFLIPTEPDGGEGTCGDFAPCYDRCAEDDALCAMTCLAHSGEACLTCGVDAMFGPCSTGRCGSEALALDRCMRGCPDPDSDYAACISTTCAAQWAAYDTCWREGFDAGLCAEDHAACGGMVPGR